MTKSNSVPKTIPPNLFPFYLCVLSLLDPSVCAVNISMEQFKLSKYELANKINQGWSCDENLLKDSQYRIFIAIILVNNKFKVNLLMSSL